MPTKFWIRYNPGRIKNKKWMRKEGNEGSVNLCLMHWFSFRVKGELISGNMKELMQHILPIFVSLACKLSDISNINFTRSQIPTFVFPISDLLSLLILLAGRAICQAGSRAICQGAGSSTSAGHVRKAAVWIGLWKLYTVHGKLNNLVLKCTLSKYL